MNFKNVIAVLALTPALIACGSEKPVETPAPVVESAPVEVISASDTPWAAPVVEEASPVIDGEYVHTHYWADDAPTKTEGTATYNPETDTLEWTTVEWGQSETFKCIGTDLEDWGTCSISYDSNGNPTRVTVTDDYDGYRLSTTIFKF